jgi:hypothetical protein
MEMITSGSMGKEIGWSASKVEGLCRASKVAKINSKEDGKACYLIMDKKEFLVAVRELAISHGSVTSLEKSRRGVARAAKIAGEKRSEQAKKRKAKRAAEKR